MRIVFVFLMTVVISWGVVFDVLDSNISDKLDSSYSVNWQDIDKDLQKFIIKNEQIIIDDIISNIDKPIMDSNNSIDAQIPKIILTRNTYVILMTYIKYLIYKNQDNRAIEIYKRVIDGVNSIDNYFNINVVFKIVITNITLESLEYDLRYLSLSSIKSLKATNPKLFTLNRNDFEKSRQKYETPYMLLKNYKVMKLSSIIPKIYNQDDSRKIDISLKKLLDNYYKTFDNLYTKSNYKKFKTFFKQYEETQKKFISQYIVDIMALHIQIKKHFDISEDSYHNDIFKDIEITPFIDVPLLLNRKIEPDLATKIFYYVRYKEDGSFIDRQTDLLKVIQLNKRVSKLLE